MSEPGSSCHIHTSLWKGQSNAFWDAKASGGSKLFRQFLGGLINIRGSFAAFFAPTINSYKRYQPGSWAPTKMAWAYDNRTVGFRVVGQGKSFRIENRMPGADANPYLAFAAHWRGDGRDHEQLDCGTKYEGNAYRDTKLARLPASLREAADLLDEANWPRRIR